MSEITQTVAVTFDSGGFSDYETIDGSINGSGGNSGACLDTGWNNKCIKAAIEIHFPNRVSVVSASMDYQRVHSSGNMAYHITVYYWEDNELKQQSYGTISHPTSGQWFTLQPTINISNVEYIEFRIGASWGVGVNHCVWQGGNLRGLLDNCSVTFVTDNPNHDGTPDCPFTYESSDGLSTGDPISLWGGEKRETVTDLSVNTPAGALGFTRSYRQSKNVADPVPSTLEEGFTTPLGAGWTHNHDLRLVDQTSKILLKMPNGGIAHFSDAGSSVYTGDPGSNSKIDANGSTNDKYTLTASDESVWVFDDQGRIRSRTWANGEVWTYSYYSSGFASGLLQEVDDGYGRKLQFAYIDNSTGVDDLHLKYVGDHTVADINSPTGGEHYIEFAYTENKKEDTGNPGTVIAGGQALLSTVTDVLGEDWIYSYETEDLDSLNWIIQEDAPSVDMDGDGTADGVVTLKQLTYHPFEDLAVNGDMEADSDWTDVSSPITNVRSSTRKYTGTYSRQVEADTDAGIEGNEWDLEAGRTYTLRARVYPVSGGVEMHVSGLSVTFPVSSGTGAWQELVLVLKPQFASTGHKVQFLATTNGSQFYVDAVSIEAAQQITQERGKHVNDADFLATTDFTFQPSGDNITVEKSAERETTHYFNGSLYRGTENPAGQGGVATRDASFRPASQEDANGNATQLAWSSDGKKLNSVTDALNNQTSFTYDSQDRLQTSTDAEGRITEYIYDDVTYPNLRQPAEIKVKDTNGTTVLRHQKFTYDSKGRTTKEQLFDPADGITILQETQRTFGSSGNGSGLLESIVQKNVEAAGVDETTTTYTYDAMGRVIKSAKSSLMGTCQFSYIVYDNAGNVLGTACGLVNTTAPTTIVGLEALYDANDATKKHTRIITHLYDEMGRRVTTTVNAATSFSRTSRTIYDALSRVVRTIDNYVVQGSSAPGAWVWNASSERWEYSDIDSTPVSHGTNNDENIISDTDYNERGLVYHRRDVLGRVTLFGYDLADRLVKTVQNASQPDYDASYATGDPDLRGYVADSGIVDGDVISEQFYDATGNLVKAIDARGSVSYAVYDTLNRLTRTVQNAKSSATIDLNVGDTGYSAANDPRSAGYVPGTAPDEDIISEMVYDAMGRALTSQRLLENRGASAVWDTTYFVYDELGRQKRVIQHYAVQGTSVPADWVYESGVWKQAPSGTAISHGNNDQNIITETVYDVSGRVKETLDVNRRVTRFVYDGLNRLVMTVVNYVAQATEPENWAWSTINGQWEYSAGNAVSHGANNDENFIAQTVYNSDGRVLETRDVEGWVQYNAYDTAGRSYLTVANYVDNSYQSPSLWVWDAGQTQWEDGNNIAIDRGIGFDQNFIFMPEYDAESRIFQTRDSRGNLTRRVYDEAGRPVMTILNYMAQATEPEEWVWRYAAVDGKYAWRLSATNDTLVSFGANNDQNHISHTTYDILGRVVTIRNAVGHVSRPVYDNLGRRTLTVANYVAQANPLENWKWTNNRWEDGSGNAIEHRSDPTNEPNNFDQNIISQTVYNRAGQVVSTRDARGTETAFEYDGAGRRVMVTAAANTGQRARTYVCYDKAGRVLRTVQGYEPTGVDPDVWDAGTWAFVPTSNGYHFDENRITEYQYDAASRHVKTINPEGDEVETAYFLDGQVDSMTDPMDVVAVYRYDKLNRPKLVVQNYVSNGEDPALWVWDTNQYEESDGTLIAHGTDNDENIIMQVTYDIAGRMTQMRDPRGNVTSYEYDVLGRRTKLTNPLSNEWVTAYTEVGQAQRTTMTYPGLSTGGTYNMVHDFDRMGRLLQMDYNAAATTPKVNFTYDILGNRQTMVENDGTDDIRKTDYFYDDANRLTSVEFDNDADNTVDDTVEYEYDLGGRRTKLVINPTTDNMAVTYTYDQKGRLIALTDWDGQTTSFAYDKADRHVRTRRSNGLDSLYQHDAAGHLRTLHHLKGAAELRQTFAYAVNALGNRTQAQEITPRTSGAAIITMSHTYPALVYRGDWNDIGDYHEASVHDASVSLLFYGDSATLTMGKNDDCSIFDVYIDGTLWLSFDGYAASASDLAIPISVEGTGLHLLEVKNRLEKRIGSSGYKLRFKSLYAQPAFDIATIDYTYDEAERLLEADYSNGERIYNFTHDIAGNRLSEALSGSLVTAKTTEYEYTPANQIERMRVDGGSWTNFTYDDNGNLTSDGVNTPTWDRANRLLSMGNNAYVYNGAGDRVQQTVSGIATDYLLDVQPGLTQVLASTRNSDITRYVQGVRGIHAQEDPSGIWTYMLQDGLGSVRSQVDNTLAMVSTRHYAPYGEPYDTTGTVTTDFGYSGEMVDSNSLVYLRSRYYAPGFGSFTSLDPHEGMLSRPLSLNGYSYVHGNPINLTDPSGLFPDLNLREGFDQALDAFQDGLIWAGNKAINALDSVFGGLCLETPVRDAVLRALGQSYDSYMSTVQDARNLVRNTLISANNRIATVSHYSRMAFGFEPLEPGMTREEALLRAFGESLYNVVDVVTLGAASDIRYGAAEGDWLRVALGVAEFIPLGKLAARGGSLIRRFGGEGLESAIRWGRGYVDEAVQAGRRYWDEFASGFRRGCSFSADTEVLTPDGLKPISEIQIGDAILGYNESTGEVGVFAVTATYTQHHETTLDLTIDGEVIHTTDEHPFYVKEQGWTEAGQLNIGDAVLRADGGYGVVEAITVIDEPQTMYNLTVALAHTFVVGDNGWVVHNVDDISITSLPGSQGIRVPRQITPAEMVEITNRLYGVEFKLQIQYVVRNRNWVPEWWLYSGTEDRVSSPLAGYVQDIYHTHPSGKPKPSSADIRRLQNLIEAQEQLHGYSLQTTSGLIPTVGPASGNVITYNVHTLDNWEDTDLYNEWVKWYNSSC